MRRSSLVGLSLSTIIAAMVCSLAGTPASAASPQLTKWVQPMPRLPGGVLDPVGTYDDGTHGVAPLYKIVMRQFQANMHPDLPPTTVWGYNNYSPGPVLSVRSHQGVYVRYYNRLPTTPLFKVDLTMVPLDGMMAVPAQYAGTTRTIVHNHGAHVAPSSDGLPWMWFRPGQSRLHFYPNTQPAATDWFHDHAVGQTRSNVNAGLAGMYLIRDDREDALNLPKGKYEVGLVFQDKLFASNGQLRYPPNEDPPFSFTDDFYGDTITVNGKVWPYFNVEPRKYRFRALDASTSRFYRIGFEQGGPDLHIIGCDAQFLPKTVRVPRIMLGNAERADFIVDFSGHAGESLILTNDAKEGNGANTGDMTDANTSQLVKFIVAPRTSSSGDTSVIPAEPLPKSMLPPVPPVDKTRMITINVGVDELGREEYLFGTGGNMWHMDDPTTEITKEGDTEIWRFINMAHDTHPVHIHLLEFSILNRRPFDEAHFMATGQILFTGPAIAPDPWESGGKDVMRMPPGYVSSLRMTVERWPNHEYTGLYIYHCHILEHEEHDLMRTWSVVPTEP